MSTSNQVLNNNWSVLADPFYAMKNRTGYKLENVLALTPEQAITAVFGEEVTSLIVQNGAIDGISSVQSILFAAWCYLHLRQKQSTVKLPIAVGEEFCFPQPNKSLKLRLAGLNLLEELGHRVVPSEALQEAWVHLRTLTDANGNIINNVAYKHGLKASTVKQALLAALTARLAPGVKVLTFKTAEPAVIQVLDESPANLVYVEHNWLKTFDYLATAADVVVVLDWLAGLFPKKIVCEECPEGISVWIEDNHFLVTPKEGVFEMRRNRRFNSMLMINPLSGREIKDRVPREDLSLLNSYGSFLYGIIYGLGGYVSAPIPQLGQFVNKFLCAGDALPLTSDDEVGPADADRVYYERYVTVSRIAPTEVPFNFNPYFVEGELKYKISYSNTVSPLPIPKQFDEEGTAVEGLYLPSSSAVDKAALLEFNLVRMPRGQFIDGRRSCIQVRHVPNELRKEFILQVFEQVGENPVDYARKTFNLGGSDEDVINCLGNHLIIGLSSKLAKLIKRTAMDAALVGEIVGGQSRGFKRFGQSSVSDNNWLVESVVTPHAIWPAGMACYWGDRPVLSVKHTQTFQPNVPGVTDEATAVAVEYRPTEPVFNYGWWTVHYDKPVSVEKGDVVATVPFVTEEGTFSHYITNSVPDARVLSISWRFAQVNGTQKSLQVKLIVETLENEIKGATTSSACSPGTLRTASTMNSTLSLMLARSFSRTPTSGWTW